MPFDLGDDPARLLPASSLIAESCIETPHLVRRASDWPCQQMADPFLQDAVRRLADGVFNALGFEIVVNLGIGEAGVASEIDA